MTRSLVKYRYYKHAYNNGNPRPVVPTRLADAAALIGQSRAANLSAVILGRPQAGPGIQTQARRLFLDSGIASVARAAE